MDCGTGTCVELATDNANCGACARACTAVQSCVFGQCLENCGDGTVVAPEECDDGDRDDNDGCSATCTREPGFNCTGNFCQTICGDGLVVGNEGCDDDGTADNDGCNALCQIEPGASCTGAPSVCTRSCLGDAGTPSDNLDCTIDTCLADGGVQFIPDDTVCTGPYERCFVPEGCFIPPLHRVVITEFTIFGGPQYVELYNPTTDAGTIHGFRLGNSTQQPDLIRDPSDQATAPTVPVVIPARGYIVGTVNPPAGEAYGDLATFLVGMPGSSFHIADGGDILTVTHANGTVLDTVDFKTAVNGSPALATGDQTMVLGQFPAVPTASTQVDRTKRTEAANNSGTNWCTSFPLSSTLGNPNNSCEAVVINEVLYDFQALTTTSDDGKTFIELAGPGGANLSGMLLRGMNATSTVVGSPNTSFQNVRIPPNGYFVFADGLEPSNAQTLVPNADSVSGMALGNGNAGNTIVLSRPDGGIADKLGYGLSAVGEGADPMEDINPASISYSIARDAFSNDIDDNKTDFHFDPSPTPGTANTEVSPEIISFTPNETGSQVTSTTVTIVAKDVGNLAAINGGVPTDRHVTAMFAGVTNSIGACTFTALTDMGRGNSTLTCVAPEYYDSITPLELGARNSLLLFNPAFFATSAFSLTPFTYVAVSNETDAAGELDVCAFENTLTESTSGGDGLTVIGRAFEAGATEVTGANPTVRVEVGHGPSTADPRVWGSGWTWRATQYVNQSGDFDRYNATIPAPAAGTYRFGVRVSLDDGIYWTYCDKNNAGAGGGAYANSIFELNQLGTWTVSP